MFRGEMYLTLKLSLVEKMKKGQGLTISTEARLSLD